MGNQFKSVAVIVSIKSLLMIFNIVFWLSGILFLIFGIWAEVELSNYMESSAEFSDTILYVIVGIGVLIILICSLGCSCIVKGQSILLYMYGGFLAVILVLQLGVEISLYVYKHKLLEIFDRGLNQSFINSNSAKDNFDIMQSTLHCCGIYNYSDWFQLVPAHPVPLSCCKHEISCVTTNVHDINTEGCYPIMVNIMENYLTWILAIAICVSLFPLVGLILSCCLANQIKKTRYNAVA